MDSRTSKFQLFVAVAIFASLANCAFGSPGSTDQTYSAIVTGGPVYAMALQTDGKLLIGGGFTLVNSSSIRSHLARLFSDGSLDNTFFNSGSGVSSTVWALAVQADGRIVIGGDFTSINGTSRNRIARLNANGTVDGSFIPTNSVNGSVLAVAAQSDNKVIIGGSFNSGNFPSWNARFNADGTTDTSFSSFPNGSVNAIAIQSDGKIVIGGNFTTLNGAVRNHIARLNSDGSLDNNFQNGQAGAISTVRCIQIQSDGRILIGGDFTSINNNSRNYVARLNSDGTLDSGFAASGYGANGSVYSLSLQSNSSVVIGGAFSTFTSPTQGTANLSRVARLYADGTRDTTYTNFGINNIVQALAVQSDGRILIGGAFTTINNSNWSYLGRLYGDVYPPEFVSQPISRNTNVGATVTFSAQVSNPTASNFQWRKDGNNISGATDTSYSLFNVQVSDSGNYSVFVSNGAGGSTSSNALLQVGIAPTFTSQPSSLTVAQGQSASFSVTANGTPLNYYWKKNGTFIAGQTNASLNFASVVATNAGAYTIQASNFLGNITSTSAVMTVLYPPTITLQPIGQTIGVGSNFSVSVTASGNPAVGYQWRMNGIAINGANASSYAVTGAQTNDSGGYDVVITNSIGSITSSVAAISVNYFPPFISQQPVGGNYLVSNAFAISVGTSGTLPLYWQWRTNGTPIPGANASSYTVNSAQFTDAGSYDVVVTNMVGVVTSSVAMVNVGYAPVIAQQPRGITNVPGGVANLSCVVTGTSPINLLWSLNGNLLAGATNSNLTITNLQAGNIGYYALTATNIFGGTVSSNALLSLSGSIDPTWNGLIAYYPFSGNANDVTGNGNNGTNNGAILANDRFGNSNSAYLFDGSISYIDFGSPSDLAFTSNFTVTAWCNFSGGSQNPRIISYGFDSGYEILTDGTAGARSFHLNCNSPGFSSPASYSQNVWYSVASVIQDGIGYLYVNGVLVGSGAINTPIYMAGLQIGRKSANTTDFWGGSIDDVRIYNRALSSNDVAYLYIQESASTLIPPQKLTASFSAGPRVNLNLIGLPQQTFILQSTTNIVPPVQWFNLLTNVTDTNGIWRFSDTNVNTPQKFYRVTTP